MDQRLQYEQLIAGKLESLLIPDMQDAIWSRIKAQLDIDMPTDDGGGNAGPQSSGPGIIGWGLSVLLIAIISIFFLYKNNPVNEPQDRPSAPAEKINTPVEQTSGPPAANEKQRAFPDNKTTATPESLPAFTADSVQQNILPAPLMASQDSTSFLPPAQGTASSPPPVGDTVQKKTRGVPGINPGDYRIVPKKDSGQRQ